MRRLRKEVWLAALLACGIVIGGGVPSADAAKPATKGATGVGAVAPATLAKLSSEDATELRAGLDDVRLIGPQAGPLALEAIRARLRAGLPYALATAALETVADLDSTDVTDVVPYARHRDVTVRRAAVRAVGKVRLLTTSPSELALASATLKVALSDPDPTVRGSAAVGLGSLKDRAAVAELLVALDHRVFEAAVPIGQLCGAAECSAFVGRIGKVPFDVLTTGIGELLQRPATELSDDAKIDIVQRVRDVGTREANKFLRDAQTHWPKTGSPKVRRAIEDGIAATSASPGGG